MSRRRHATLYLLERVVWTFAGERKVKRMPAYLSDQPRYHPFRETRGHVAVFRRAEGLVPLKAFHDKTTADETCSAHDQAAFARVNPFDHGGKVSDWTRFDEGRLRDWLIDHGLEPPASATKRFNPTPWRLWYDKIHDDLDAVQLRAIRQALDRVVFFQVSELTT